MQDIPHVMDPPDILQGDVGVGVSLGLRPHDIPMPPSPREISYRSITLGKSCYSIYIMLLFVGYYIHFYNYFYVFAATCYSHDLP